MDDLLRHVNSPVRPTSSRRRRIFLSVGVVLAVVFIAAIAVERLRPAPRITMRVKRLASSELPSPLLMPFFSLEISNLTSRDVVLLPPTIQIATSTRRWTNWNMPESPRASILIRATNKSRTVSIKLPPGHYNWKVKTRAQIFRPKWLQNLTRSLPTDLQRRLNFTYEDVELAEQSR